jgi:hypothetical protein
MIDGKDNVYGVLVTSYDGEGNSEDTIKGGLTKREYFAGLALQGILANNKTLNGAIEAVEYADELIKELNK